jgi:hypothetical protein
MPGTRPTHAIPDVGAFDRATRAYLDRMAALDYAEASIYLIDSADRWPSPADTALAEGPIQDYSGRLSGFPDGHLAVTLERAEGARPLHAEFQRVILSEDSRFIIHLTVQDVRVSLEVHGHQLGPYCPEQDPPEIWGTRA